MNHLTQKELLSEGFWSKFGQGLKSAGKAGWEVGKFSAKHVAPSVYNPLAATANATKELNQNIIKATTPTEKYISDQLHMRGYVVEGQIEPIPMPRGFSKEKQTFFVTVNKMAFNPTSKKMEVSTLPRDLDIPLVVDKYGSIIENLRNNPEKIKAFKGKTITRPPKPNPQVINTPVAPATPVTSVAP